MSGIEIHGMHLMYENLISEGEKLLQLLKEQKYTSIKGIHKLEGRIKKDLQFLNVALKKENMKKEHLVCTNLHYFKAVVEQASLEPECEAVFETFSYNTPEVRKKRLTVDIVSCKGKKWTKIIARNPSALLQIFKEGDAFGRRSIIDHASSYVQAASKNLYLFSPPQVVFYFVNGVPEKLKWYLESLSITVKGEVKQLEETSSCSSSSESDEEECSCSPQDTVLLTTDKESSSVKKLNLCVTTMIAYVTSLTNGGCNRTFHEPLLNEQAEWERERPVKSLLNKLFEGKELICSCTAFNDFNNIVATIGGAAEKCRAEELTSIMSVVPDVSCTALKPSGKIKERSLVIFGTGHHHKAITVTANKGFVDAAQQKGVKFAVIMHESRALTELKELPMCSEILEKS